MIDNYYVYKREVDWSLLNQGLSIPLDIQVIFQNNIKKFIGRGESKDILQIRYNPNSEIADKLRHNFSYTYRYLYELRSILEEKQKKYFKIPEDNKEFLAIYTTEYADTYLVECITQTETAETRTLLVHEDEQTYEVSVNYSEVDSTASIERIQQLTKIRKLNYLHKANGVTEKQLDIAVSKGWITAEGKSKIIR